MVILDHIIKMITTLIQIHIVCGKSDIKQPLMVDIVTYNSYDTLYNDILQIQLLTGVEFARCMCVSVYALVDDGVSQ